MIGFTRSTAPARTGKYPAQRQPRATAEIPTPMRVRRGIQAAATVLVTAAFLAACGDDDGAGPTTASAAGTYTATTFTTTAGGAMVNQLAGGASLRLVLAADATVTGRLFIPDADEGGGDLDASMAGTWSLRDGVVRFAQTADTFVRNMPFQADGSTLRGDATFGGTTVRVVLGRQ